MQDKANTHVFRCQLCQKNFSIPVEEFSFESHPYAAFGLGPECYKKHFLPPSMEKQSLKDRTMPGPIFLPDQFSNMNIQNIKKGLSVLGESEENPYAIGALSISEFYSTAFLTTPFPVEFIDKEIFSNNAWRAVNAQIEEWANGTYPPELVTFLKNQNDRMRDSYFLELEEAGWNNEMQLKFQSILENTIGVKSTEALDIKDTHLLMFHLTGDTGIAHIKAGLIPSTYAELIAADASLLAIMNCNAQGLASISLETQLPVQICSQQNDRLDPRAFRNQVSDVGFGPCGLPSLESSSPSERSRISGRMLRAMLLCNISKNDNAQDMITKSLNRVAVKSPEDAKILSAGNKYFTEFMDGKSIFSEGRPTPVRWQHSVFECKAWQMAMASPNLLDSFQPCSPAPMALRNLLVGANKESGINTFALIVSSGQIDIQTFKTEGNNPRIRADSVYQQICKDANKTYNEMTLENRVFVLMAHSGTLAVSQTSFSSEIINDDMQKLRGISSDQLLQVNGKMVSTVQTLAYQSESDVIVPSRCPDGERPWASLTGGVYKEARFFGILGTCFSPLHYDKTKSRYNKIYPVPNEEERAYFEQQVKSDPNHYSMLNAAAAFFDRKKV